jgi:WD40 repeat protein
VTAVALSEEGNRIVVGTADGLVEVWKVGAYSAEHRFTSVHNWVDGVALSPDQKRVACVSLDQPERIRGHQDASTLAVQISEINLSTTVVRRVNGIYHAAGVRFSPDSLHLAVMSSQAGASRRLQPVAEDSGVPGLSLLHVSGNCIFSAAHQRIVAAHGIWQLRNDGLELLHRLSEIPQDVRPDWQQAFFSEAPYFTNEVIPVPIVLRSAGILVADLDKAKPQAYLRLVGNTARYPAQIQYIPGSDLSPAGWLLVNIADADIALVNLTTAKYQLLLQPDMHGSKLPNVFQIAASSDGRWIAGCGPWGAAIWRVPSRIKAR